MSVPSSPSENPLRENPDNYWERLNQPEETAKAYEAFCSYLQLPTAGRTVLAAYNANQQKTGKKQAKSTPGNWTFWSSNFKWKERAGAYDNHLASELRKTQEDERKANARRLEQDHLKELGEYRGQLRDLNAAALSASILLLDKCVTRLNNISDKDLAELPLDKVGNLVRTATAAAATASMAQAQALAVDELIGLLDEQKSDTED